MDIQIHPDLEHFTSPTFLDSDLDIEERERSEEYLKYMKKIDAYFKSQYTNKDWIVSTESRPLYL